MNHTQTKTRREIEAALERAGAALSNCARHLADRLETEIALGERKELDRLRRAWDLAHGEWQQTLPPATEQPARQDAAYAELRALAEKATLGPWEVDTTHNEGEYGGSENPGRGFDSYTIFDASGNVIADTLNSDAEVHVDGDEDGMHAWDETGRRNVAYIAAANPAAVLALLADNDRLTERVAVLETHTKKLEARNGQLLIAGHGLSNIAYNLAQPSSTLTDEARASMDLCRKQWDAARLPSATPHPHADEAAKVEWMPIETALRGGTLILLGRAEDKEDGRGAISTPGRWHDEDHDGPDNMGHDAGFMDDEFQQFAWGRSFGAESHRSQGFQPTHWMPLPAPPSPAEGKSA